MATPTSNQSDFVTEVKNIVSQSGNSHPASSIVKNIDVAAMISKLVKSRDRGLFKPSEPESSSGLMNSGVELISKTIMGRVEDNENIFKLFPDIELAAQIVISSILSPKDMVNSELIYRTKSSNLPPQLVAKMVDVVKESLEIEYSLKDELNEILRRSLFQTGSFIKAVLPEAAVDQVINQHYIRLMQGSDRLEGQQLRITGPRAYQPHFCAHVVTLTH